MSGASSPTYARVGSEVGKYDEENTPLQCPAEQQQRQHRRSKATALVGAAAAGGALMGVLLMAAVMAFFMPPQRTGTANGKDSLLTTYGSAPVDCNGTCLNDGQPAIPRYQFELQKHKLYVGGKNLGHGSVAFMPQKLGGGVSVMDLETGRSLASLWYANYGDYGAIPHHIIGFPSEDPLTQFEFINSCQGGKNTHLYNLQNIDPNPPAATNIYRLRYDGNTLMIAENVSDSTGLGLGVHTTIDPSTAETYAVSDGQKDIVALFDRRTTAVKAAFRYDWKGNTPHDLSTNWIKGGVLTVSRIYPDAKTGKFDLLGAKGNKIDVELAPMAEGKLEAGEIPGADRAGTVAADGWVYHPSGRWAAEIVRMLGGAVLHNLTSDAAEYAPISFLSFNSDTPGQVPARRVAKDKWEFTIDYVGSPGHELGWTPDGTKFMMMNNLRENSVGLFDTSSPDPAKWHKLGAVKDPLWKGAYPNPFHMAFSHDSKKAYFVVLRPPPQRSNLMIVDMTNFHIIKELQGVAPDMQSAVTTMDGRFLLIVTGGFQRFSSGIFVLDIETDEPLGFIPAPGGHHDIGIVPRTVSDMKYTRAICM